MFSKIGLFLGAGASNPLNKPTTEEFMNKLVNYSAKSKEDKILQSFLHIYEFRDIEHVLQSIKDLRTLYRSKGGIYLKEMNSKSALSFSLHGLSFNECESMLKNIEEYVEDKIFEEYHWKDKDNDPLNELHYELIDYLTRISEVRIFTTNYDLAIEELCDSHSESFKLVDGFVRKPSDRDYSTWEGKFDIPTDNPNRHNIYLYKLHGSLNWKEHVKHGIVKTNEESKPKDSKFIKNMLIYPTLHPKSEELQKPFSTIIDEFAKQMETLDVCIVIGFSFRDGFNNVFEKFVENGKALFVISPTGHENFMSNQTKIKLAKINKDDEITDYDDTTGFNLDLHFIQKKFNSDNLDFILTYLQNTLGVPPLD